MKKIQFFLLIISLCILTIACVEKGNEGPPKLFEEIESNVPLEPKGNPAVVDIKNIKLDSEKLGQDDKLRIPLFDDEFVDIEKMDVKDSPGIGNNYRVEKDPQGRVIVAEVNGKYAIDIILSKGRIYQIRYVKEGVYQIRKIDQSKYLPEGDSSPPDDEGAGDPLPCANTDPPGQIDVMVLYTDDVMAAVGDRDAIEAEIFLALYETNLSYLNSNVNQRLELVHIAEVNYDESTDIQTDLARLRNPSDGFIDGIHALRDAHAADLVCLIKENETSWCGWAYTMTNVSDNFEDDAFSVVARACATGNYSFGHELGHNMGANHDCHVTTGVLPFDYVHGYVETSPTDVATGRWRTIMAYNTECGSADPCTRILQWSNPNIDYPFASASGDPTGTSSGACKADNRLVLNNTASTVANFRCRSRGPDNIWIKDTWDDTGAEPDPATVGQSMYRSPYIWVRNSKDIELNNLHQHERPQDGSPTYVYVKLLNGGFPIGGDLELYYANASTSSLSWSSDWTLIDSKARNLAANTSDIVEFNWGSSLPGTGHYCLVARWVSASDPMAVTEGTNIGTNVRNNNNIAWKNVNILPMSRGDEYVAELNFDGRRSKLEVLFETDNVTLPFFPSAGDIHIEFDDQTNAYIEQEAIQLNGLQENNGRYKVVSNKDCSIDLLKIRRAYRGRMQVEFKSHEKAAKKKYFVNIKQNNGENNEDGGVAYVINLEEIK